LPSFLWRQFDNHPESPRVWSSLGHAVSTRMHFALANELYEYGADMDRADVGYPLSILTNLANAGEAPPPELLAEIEARLDGHPISAFGVTALIIVARHPGLPADTRIRILEAATANPDWRSEHGRAVAFWHLGRLRRRIGNLEGAAAAWEAGLAIEPEARRPRADLEALYEEQPELERAAGGGNENAPAVRRGR
ncbi:MAG TPA: hypothetical protein VKA64_05820, partial [Gammaproteobacteria bacterium]|nr:hypothetical protein [Gammaproteobacteria bacterium]